VVLLIFAETTILLLHNLIVRLGFICVAENGTTAGVGKKWK
jgi:hypothetical protein